ncbi:glycogen synthase [Citrobacter koseri]|uniref:starch synthase n=1 Tax=Citrobacter koseri TaxID=545 RepID=A0A2X2WFT3_CITKO|nr:glycogen synthase [Citrobacter koseri]
MQVLHVCSEMFPLLKTGGLADVIGALPAAQIADGVDARVLLPAFPDIRRGIPDAQVVTRRDTFAGRITLLFGHYNGVGIYLIDAPHLYDRPGSPYHDTNLFAYTDNVLRFALLGWVGCEMACGLIHSGARMWCMRTTGMQAWRLRIWPRAGVRRNRCLPYTTWPIKACFMHITWMTSNCHGRSITCMVWSLTGRFHS